MVNIDEQPEIAGYFHLMARGFGKSSLWAFLPGTPHFLHFFWVIGTGLIAWEKLSSREGLLAQNRVRLPSSVWQNS